MKRRQAIVGLCLAWSLSGLWGCAGAPSARASAPQEAETCEDCGGSCPCLSSAFEPAPSALSRLSVWHPAPAATSSPALTARAFDYWQLDDAGFMQELWPALFASLDYMRGQVPAKRQDELRRTFDTLLALMEPSGTLAGRQAPPVLDLTFVTGQDQGQAWEGVLCRVFVVMDSGASPGVSFLLKRRVGKEAQPNQVLFWGSSGYEEGAPFSALIEREPSVARSSSRLILSAGHHMVPVAGFEEYSEAGSLVLDLLTRVLWLKISQQAYLEPKLVRATGRPVPASYPQAAGLKVQERELEEIFEDTAFIPREDIESLMLPGLKGQGER